MWPKQTDPRITQPGEARMIRTRHLMWCPCHGLAVSTWSGYVYAGPLGSLNTLMSLPLEIRDEYLDICERVKIDMLRILQEMK